MKFFKKLGLLLTVGAMLFTSTSLFAGSADAALKAADRAKVANLDMSAKAISQRYLDALASGSAEQTLKLFTHDAVVNSPLYGDRTAASFYPELYKDTSESKLTLIGVAEGHSESLNRDTIALWFTFDWILANGEPAPFDVVDMLELDKETRLIKKINIIYDTYKVRTKFNESKNGTK